MKRTADELKGAAEYRLTARKEQLVGHKLIVDEKFGMIMFKFLLAICVGLVLAGAAIVILGNDLKPQTVAGSLGLVSAMYVMSEKLVKTWTDAKAAGVKGRKIHKRWERISVDNMIQAIIEEWDDEEEGNDEEDQSEEESEQKKDK